MRDEEKTREQLIDELRRSRDRLAELESSRAQSKRTQVQLMGMVECFADMSTDPQKNIRRLTRACGRIVGSDLALYHGCDGGEIQVAARWEKAPDSQTVGTPDGEIPVGMVREAEHGVAILANLPESGYGKSDPSLSASGFRTYVGAAVRFGADCFGALSTYYRTDFTPTDEEQSILKVMGAAVALEEKRKKDEEALMRGEQMLSNILSASPFAISYFEQGKIKWANRTMAEMFGEKSEEAYRGRHTREFYVSDDEYNRIRQIVYESFAAGKVARAEAKFRRDDGSVFEGRITVSAPDPANPRKGTVATISDISARKRAEETLRLEKYKFETLSEHAPFAMAMIGEEGTFHYVNPKFREVFGYDLDDVPDVRAWFRKLYPDSQYRREVERVWSNLMNESRGEELSAAVFVVTCKDGTEKKVHFQPVRLKTGEHLMTCEDITERTRAEEALRRSEEKYRSLYERSLRADDIHRSLLNSCADSIVIYDMEGRVKYVSDSFTQNFGWTLDELRGKRIPYVPTEEREVTRDRIDKVVIDGLPSSGFETKRITKDGRLLDVSISASRYHDHDGSPAGMLVIVCDVTERRKSQEALARSEQQLRLLSAQLLTAQETERKRVAQELHDGIGQSLTSIKFRIENALKQTNEHMTSNQAEAVRAIIFLIQNAIEEVRRISIDLRPSLLDDLGILATITWFCREFQATFSRINITKQIDLKEHEIPGPLKIVIFRLMQEALNNVAKHSDADHVQLSLGRSNGRLELVVEDNGSGFEPSAILAGGSEPKGFGLASMAERTESSGGVFTLEAGMSRPTVLRASWPDEGARSTSR